jgi:hypothetical protein
MHRPKIPLSVLQADYIARQKAEREAEHKAAFMRLAKAKPPPDQQQQQPRKPVRKRKIKQRTKPKRKQRNPRRDPATEWLKVHYSRGAWKKIGEQSLHNEMVADGLKISRTTLARMRGTRKK